MTNSLLPSTMEVLFRNITSHHIFCGHASDSWDRPPQLQIELDIDSDKAYQVRLRYWGCWYCSLIPWWHAFRPLLATFLTAVTLTVICDNFQQEGQNQIWLSDSTEKQHKRHVNQKKGSDWGKPEDPILTFGRPFSLPKWQWNTTTIMDSLFSWPMGSKQKLGWANAQHPWVQQGHLFPAECLHSILGSCSP